MFLMHPNGCGHSRWLLHGGVWGEAPEASDDLYLLQPIVQWKMLFLHSVEHSTLSNKLAGTSM